MFTYAQLKASTLTLLDEKQASTGDIASQVEYHLKRVMDEVAIEVKPRELRAKAGPVSVTSATTSISIPTDFSVTDLLEPSGIYVDTDSSDTEEGLEWSYVDFDAWLSLRSVYSDERPCHVWTLDELGEILLNPWPTSGETWSVLLYYYRQPAAYSGASTPELPPGHEHILVLGATLSFPNLFQGDERQALLVKYQRDFEMAKRRLMNHRGIAKSSLRLGASGNPTRSSGMNFNWGPYHTS